MITPRLVSTILDQYRLDWFGIHGVAHWARVLENGLRLAERTGADVDVVRLFAVFHDACRTTDSTCFDHGRRGAELARTLWAQGSFPDLSADAFHLLDDACARHTDGLTEADITVQTCWDADRLDLGRVGIAPEPQYLSTDAARDYETLIWASRRSRSGHVPSFVRKDWGIR